jgi:hypothetical protein
VVSLAQMVVQVAEERHLYRQQSLLRVVGLLGRRLFQVLLDIPEAQALQLPLRV